MLFPLLLRFFAITSSIYALTLVPPMCVALWFDDGHAKDFAELILLSVSAGLIVWRTHSISFEQLKPRYSFFLVATMWVVFSIWSSLPLLIVTNIPFEEAIFETVSGLTTAGGTVFDDIDALPQSILYYRSQLQWLGGMGIIVLMIAVFPLLNIGGMRLFKAETPGPFKDDKLTPRIRHTARYLWFIYLALSIACGIAFYFAGMSWFDAINHAMTAISTGGFSTHTASIGHFDSVPIEVVANIFMLLGSLNFALHFVYSRSLDLSCYWRDQETRLFFYMVVGLIVITAVTLFVNGNYEQLSTAFRVASFEVISIVSSTGYGISDFTHWPLFLPALLMLFSYVGGCAGSTAGGMKVIRIAIVLQGIGKQIRLLIHPTAIYQQKFNGRGVQPPIQQTIYGFLFIYTITAMLFMLVLLLTGEDYLTAFGAVTACINVLGPGLGKVASSFHELTPTAKYALTVLMILGRLEVYTLVVLISPMYWQSLDLRRAGVSPHNVTIQS